MDGWKNGAGSARTWPENRLLKALCAAAALGTALSAAPEAGAAEPVRTASLTPGSERLRETELPPALGGADAERYRHIFRLQAGGAWAAAEAEIRQLRDPLLLGHVQAQRFLHRKY